MGTPGTPLHSLGSAHAFSVQSMLVSGWLAGASACLCCPCAYAWGGQQGPPPHVALALSMQGPQSLHFVRVSQPCGFVCVCSLVLWPVCLCACVAVL